MGTTFRGITCVIKKLRWLNGRGHFRQLKFPRRRALFINVGKYLYLQTKM